MRAFGHWVSDEIERWQLGAPRRIGPTGALGLSLCSRWEPERVFVIVNVYADESGTHGTSDYMILGGYVGQLGRWNAFDMRWNRRLARAGLTYFHSVEHSRRRDFAALGYDLLKLEGKYLTCGFVIKLDKQSYNDFYIAGLRPRKPQLDTMYGVCYRYLIGFLVHELPTLISRNDITINIMLELGARGSKDAVRIHDRIKKLLPNDTKTLGEISFGEKKKFPGLQAADSLVHPAFGEEGRGNLDLREIPSMGTLEDVRRATRDTVTPPTFHSSLGAEELGSLKKACLSGFHLQELNLEPASLHLPRALR